MYTSSLNVFSDGHVDDRVSCSPTLGRSLFTHAIGSPSDVRVSRLTKRARKHRRRQARINMLENGVVRRTVPDSSIRRRGRLIR